MIVAIVVLGVAGTLGAKLGRSVENVKGVEEEEGTEELATGESVEESEGPGSVVVVLTLLLKTPC